jgi:demethoxyubiquinone hydroxylase (CLK1/Coq7/Cat5 family)
MNDNDIEAIDKKINEVANDDLNGLESNLNHMDSDELRSEAKEMINDCSRNELQKVIKLLIKISRKSFEDE